MLQIVPQNSQRKPFKESALKLRKDALGITSDQRLAIIKKADPI
jgi:hypothetical protein